MIRECHVIVRTENDYPVLVCADRERAEMIAGTNSYRDEFYVATMRIVEEESRTEEPESKPDEHSRGAK